MKAKMVSIAFFLGLGQNAIAGQEIKEGRWDVTTSIEMSGMPVELPPVTHSQCITKENLVPDTKQQHGDCVISHSQVNSNTVSWTVTCETNEGTMTGNGEIIYQSDSFKGGLNMELNSPQGVMTMASTMTGQYKGACE